MTSTKIIAIYIQLLEEGTPTLRPTQAVALGNDMYKILSTPDYDGEDEIWEFLPETIVRGCLRRTDDGKQVLLAVRANTNAEEIIAKYPFASIIDMGVNCVCNGKRAITSTKALDIGNNLYVLLPTDDYDPQVQAWEFSPGSLVRAIYEKSPDGHTILLAFDQIREDRVNEYYAQHILDK